MLKDIFCHACKNKSVLKLWYGEIPHTHTYTNTCVGIYGMTQIIPFWGEGQEGCFPEQDTHIVCIQQSRPSYLLTQFIQLKDCICMWLGSPFLKKQLKVSYMRSVLLKHAASVQINRLIYSIYFDDLTKYQSWHTHACPHTK